MVVAPTGAGKTVIACSVMEQTMIRLNRCLFLAHRGELIDQTCDKLAECGLPHGVIKANDPRLNLRALLQVGSVQTVVNRLKRLDMNFDVVIVDEAHRHLCETNQKIAASILEVNPRAIIIGLTATPYRGDGKGLGDFFDALIEVTTTERLIEEGFLVHPRVLRAARLDLAGVRMVGGDYSSRELGDKVNKPKLVGNIVKEWQKHASDRLTVAFCVNVAHAQVIAEAFTSAGIPAACVEGTMKPEERARVLAEWRAGRIRVVTNCMILTEGFDFPAVSAVILARPTKSRGLWKQCVGRGLRIWPGKEDCLILDHANCTLAHGYVTEPDRISLERGISNERPRAERRCRACGAKYAGAPTFCPGCGASLRRESGERLDDDLPGLRDDGHVLVEDEQAPRPKKRKKTPEEIRDALHADIREWRAKKYDVNWVQVRHKARSGRWIPYNAIIDEERRMGSPIKTAVIERGGRRERVTL